MATTFVDVTYRGLKVQEKAKLVDDGGAAFLESELPLPVGTTLAVISEGVARTARVAGVVEHEAGANGQPAGMRLTWAGEASSSPAPAPAPAPEEAPRADAEAAPAVETSSDDVSSPGDPDVSSDGTPPPTPTNGTHPGAYVPGKKPRKSKKRR
jgi:hypothetical protein